ncbi:hypothetical protein E3O44_05675 [Cryobacterium algoricola]|uniref:Uncharacterized protein n=1 Tax=Cryobacterium algoricola TaxID=1259183 RepID=A0ABY2IG58_9MICO|nr:hypothetical protein [Cryobacterium algoricola]TFB88167.1 hypothetical protein E3O44_05675 [Cryobacterium algoricola]
MLREFSGNTAQALEQQARQAVVVREVGGRMIDLETTTGAQQCDCSDGPLPPRAAVIRQNGELVGELLVWVKYGRLVGIEQTWFTAEPPSRWPTAEELVFQ